MSYYVQTSVTILLMVSSSFRSEARASKRKKCKSIFREKKVDLHQKKDKTKTDKGTVSLNDSISYFYFLKNYIKIYTHVEWRNSAQSKFRGRFLWDTCNKYVTYKKDKVIKMRHKDKGHCVIIVYFIICDLNNSICTFNSWLYTIDS